MCTPLILKKIHIITQQYYNVYTFTFMEKYFLLLKTVFLQI